MVRKEVRQKQILQHIVELGRIPSSIVLAEALGFSDRTIRRDLEELKEQIMADVPDVAIEDIRRKVINRLRQRVPEMKDGDLIKIAEFFLAKKSEVKQQVDASITIKAWDPDAGVEG